MVTSRDNKGLHSNRRHVLGLDVTVAGADGHGAPRRGDKRQLKAQDVTAKLVRFDIMHKIPKNILFCISSQESKIPRGRNKIWRTSHIPPNFHLTSYFQAHPRCLVSSSPVAGVGRCACTIPHPGSVASLPPRSVCRRRV